MSASESQRLKELYEFGPFRVDPEKENLLRAGEPVPLTPKTFQILLVLVRHSQEVVTKDDLMKLVWPDTFVEEANLSRNIFMLRKALGDSSKDHQYIITVPGRGYRLAESVRLVQDEELSIVAANHSKVQVQVAETKPWGKIVAAGILALAAAAGLFQLFGHRPVVLGQKDTVVLADFANTTGEPVFDDTLRQGLAVQLEQSPIIGVISEPRVQHTLRLMGQSAGAPLTIGLAREVCIRTGSAAVLEGSIAPVGSQYVLGLKATNCQTGDTLDEEQLQAAKKEDVLGALSQISSKFRARIGESLARVKQHDTPLAEATTPSLEALKSYSEAWKVAFTMGSASAVPLVRRAIEMDPKFVMAYAYLGRLYGDMGELALARQSLTQAYQLRDRVSDREKFFITCNYDRLVTGDLDKARETCELWERTYTRDSGPPSLLSGGISAGVGQYAKGALEAGKAIELDPDGSWGYVNLAGNDISLNRLDEAQSALQRASERKLELPEFLAEQYEIAFLKGDGAGLEGIVARSEGKRGAEDWITAKQAEVLAYSGHLQDARRMSRLAEDLAHEPDGRERSAQYETAEAVREALVGNAHEARRAAMAALALSKGRDVEYGAALALARSGDFSLSQTLANDLEKRFPEDTLVRFSYLPTLHAFFALRDKKPSVGIELLQAASPYELGSNVDSLGFTGALYPIYVRGECYLAAHQGTQASGEFQKIVDHLGIVVSDPIGALAHLQLGRAYSLSGDKSRAKSTYRDFLTLWKGADPDIPILKQAKAEYAWLQ